MRLWFLGRLYWLHWVSFCLSECVFGFLVAFVGCTGFPAIPSECVYGLLVAFIGGTGSPSCLSECVSGLFLSVFSILLVRFNLVFSFLLLECLLSECVLVLAFRQCPRLLTCSFVLYMFVLYLFCPVLCL